jgi:hypothetical protein
MSSHTADRKAERSRSQVPVSGERPRSANARHECFVVDASVSIKSAETAEMNETQASAPACARRSLRPWQSSSPPSRQPGCRVSSNSGVSLATRAAPAFRAKRGRDRPWGYARRAVRAGRDAYTESRTPSLVGEMFVLRHIQERRSKLG